MKKLFFIIVFFILSIISFGKVIANGNENYTEEKLPVKIRVVEDLGIDTSGVDFGIIFQGQTKEQPDYEGKITVIGKGIQKRKYFTMEIKDSKNGYVAYEDKNQTFNVQLTKKGTKTFNDNEKMNATLKLIPSNGILMPGEGNFLEGLIGSVVEIILKKNGITIEGNRGEFRVTGNLVADENQAVGDYEGHLYVRVKTIFLDFK